MAEPRKLQLADQVLVNALGHLSARIMHDAARSQRMIDILAEVLPHVSHDHPAIKPLIAPAEGYLHNILGAEAPRGFASARLAAGDAVAGFFEWRAAQALDAWRTKLAEGEG